MILYRALLAGIALFWLGAAWKTWRGQRDSRWRLGPDAPGPGLPDTDGAAGGRLPRLVVVVPARDEAKGIADCIAALRRSDHPDFQICVFDDGSTDGTAALGEAALAAPSPLLGTGERRGQVRNGGDAALPAGWKGKPWALQRATREVDAEWIVFIDADVRVHPAALSRAHVRALTDGVDLLSGFGRLVMGSFWEKVIQPSVGGLILAGNDLDAVNDPAKPDKVIANGQFILVRRAAYEAVGGHGAVRADILDDVGLAKAFVAKEYAIRVLFMRELFSCRMYTNLAELWFGWTKNLFAGMGYRRDRLVFLVAFIVVEMLLPYAVAVVGVVRGDRELLLWGAGLILLIHGVRAWLDTIFNQERRYGLLQPLGAAMLVGLLVDSARRSRTGQVVWKGRRYVAAATDSGMGAAAEPPAAEPPLGTA